MSARRWRTFALAAALAGPPVALAAAAPGAAPVSPGENGVSRLADRLAAAIRARLEPGAGKVLAVTGTEATVDIGGLETGTVLEWLVPDRPLLDPDSLDPRGQALRPGGRLRVTASGSESSTVRLEPLPGEPETPATGALVRAPLRPLRLRIQPGVADPSLVGLLDVLLAVLPGRLERGGQLTVLTGGGPDPGVRASEVVAARNEEAAVVLHLATRGSRIEAVAEIARGGSRPLFDVAQLEADAVPAALWRRRSLGPAAWRERARIEIQGEALALLASPPTPGERGSLLVLTDGHLLEVRGEPDLTLSVTPIADLGRLPRASLRTRVRAGSLTLAASGAGARACFATTDLALGYCQAASGDKLDPIDGVPVSGPSGLLLARYRPGSDVLDGELRAPGGARAGDIAAFLALARTPEGGLVVQRPDGSSDWLGSDLRPAAAPARGCGDGILGLGGSRRLCSAPVRRGEPDLLLEPGTGFSLAVPGSVVALARADLDGDGRPELVAASAGPAHSALYVFQGGE